MQDTPSTPAPRRPIANEAPRFWRLWWPALAAAGVALAGLGAVTVQHVQIKALQTQVDSLQHELDTLKAAPAGDTSATLSRPGTLRRPAEIPLPKGREELEALRAQATGLQDEIARLEALEGESATMQQELAQMARQAMPEEFAALEEARDKALRIRCINNLKQLGLAARIWATDNNDILPPDLVSMANEMGTPKILHCPADTSRQMAESWDSFTTANSSYEYLAPSGSEVDSQQVMFRCRVHGFVTLCDGSAQQIAAEDQSQRLQWRDGKLWYNPEVQPAGAQSGQAPQMDVEMMKRYGLLPPDAEIPQEASVDAAPELQMDEQMMRRYGLLPPEPADPSLIDPDPDASDSRSPEEIEALIRRYGFVPSQFELPKQEEQE